MIHLIHYGKKKYLIHLLSANFANLSDGHVTATKYANIYKINILQLYSMHFIIYHLIYYNFWPHTMDRYFYLRKKKYNVLFNVTKFLLDQYELLSSKHSNHQFFSSNFWIASLIKFENSYMIIWIPIKFTLSK